MIFSKPVSYSIQALIYLAKNQNDGPVLTSRIAADGKLPAPFLSKILGNLTTAGYVEATRGPGGGFNLAVDPKTISLFDIYVLYEGFQLTQECLLGLGKCGGDTACAVHQRWKEPKRHYMEFLRETTIADLVVAKKSRAKTVRA
jgi:Rrf2 family transcriptional regulator, iron-sulfur cluster assembly transcription factor